MIDFFASLYEWFGLNPLYKTDLGDLLRGWDSTCTGFIDSPWYTYIGIIMILITVLMYAFQYHIKDSSGFNKKHHWWLMSLIIITLNFFIAFIIPFNIIQANNYCQDLSLSVADCLGFGFSNAIWSFLLFVLISTPPLFRKLSHNCRETTFYRP
jgi:hypothetical protein